MLRAGDKDLVSCGNKFFSERARSEIDRCGRPGGKDDSRGIGRADPARDRLPRVFIRVCRKASRSVDGAVHVAGALPVKRLYRFDHAARLLRRRRVIEIDRARSLPRKRGEIPDRSEDAVIFHSALFSRSARQRSPAPAAAASSRRSVLPREAPLPACPGSSTAAGSSSPSRKTDPYSRERRYS